ncbi:hypothetical protein B0H13DRAFT_1089558 [Mycena leptocephala]|nr:hypothetical protein B0H13DRAFT_1089558 [Mycena leptocephala]
MTEFWYLISNMWIGTFFYGIYLVLFCICIYILLHRPRNMANTILLVTAIVLFTLSTVQAIINIILGAADIDNIDIPYDQLFLAMDMIYVANNVLADGLVIYRCYVIWNRNIYVIILPIIMLVVTSVFGWDLDLPLPPFFEISLATNVLVTGLTVGRIWWIYRQNCMHLTSDMRKKYFTSMAIIVESGLLYSVATMVYLIMGTIPFTRVAQDPTATMLSQLVPIVPTLIIVRIGLGLGIERVESTGSSALTLDSDNDVHSRSRPHILGVIRPNNSGYYDVEKGLPAMASQGKSGPRSF